MFPGEQIQAAHCSAITTGHVSGLLAHFSPRSPLHREHASTNVGKCLRVSLRLGSERGYICSTVAELGRLTVLIVVTMPHQKQRQSLPHMRRLRVLRFLLSSRCALTMFAASLRRRESSSPAAFSSRCCWRKRLARPRARLIAWARSSRSSCSPFIGTPSRVCCE